MTTQLQEKIRARRREAREGAQNAQRAEILGRELETLRADLARHEQRHAALVKLGKGRIEYPLSTPVPGYGVVQFAPLQSLKTGAELAADAEQNLAHLRGEIERREAEIARLLK